MKNKGVILTAVLVYLAAAATTYWVLSNKESGQMGATNYQSPTAKEQQAQAATPKGIGDIAPKDPKTEECPINGQMYSKAQQQRWSMRRPLGIMIENHTEARPQSGLSSADVVYEAVAEGGITRFLTIFYCEDAPYVGPVRSARIYYIRLLQGYGQYPLYAHVGGANKEGPADALGEIESLGWAGYNDLNQFSVPFPVFYRDYDRLPNRATEHTVYSSTAKLWDYAAKKRELSQVDDKGVKWDKGFTPWKFADEAAPGDRGTVNKISFGFWTNLASDFAVDWNYDKQTNTYSRVNGGQPHQDKNTGKPLMAKNVVVVFAKESVANDGYEAGQHILYKIIGSGDAIVFQNGKAIKGTWNKADDETMMTFEDASGKQIPLVRGKDFIEVLPPGNEVTY